MIFYICFSAFSLYALVSAFMSIQKFGVSTGGATVVSFLYFCGYTILSWKHFSTGQNITLLCVFGISGLIIYLIWVAVVSHRMDVLEDFRRKSDFTANLTRGLFKFGLRMLTGDSMDEEQIDSFVDNRAMSGLRYKIDSSIQNKLAERYDDSSLHPLGYISNIIYVISVFICVFVLHNN